jgi:hypothetical protein
MPSVGPQSVCLLALTLYPSRIGSDRSTMHVYSNVDEVKTYLDGRYLSPPESVWRLLKFQVHEEYPPVTRLAVHEPGHHTVYFDDDASPEEIEGRMERAASTLIAFFRYNEQHPDGRQYLYSEFPAHFVFDKGKKEWRPRQRGTAIGRMHHCSPRDGERFYVRLLLTVRPGPTSFEDLRTINGELHPTFRAACAALHLLDDDREWHLTFEEASGSASGRQLRQLFADALIWGTVGDPLWLWIDFMVHICDDLPYAISRFPLTGRLAGLAHPQYDYGLFLISRLLKPHGKDLDDFGLPMPRGAWPTNFIPDPSPRRPASEPDPETAANLVRQLNPDQRRCFDQVVSAVLDGSEPRHFFIQGAGGTGKTFLYRALYAHLRVAGKLVICVASSGIAATLLPLGLTAHSQFIIPLILDESSTCNVTRESYLGRLLAKVDLIVWDEVPMQHRFAFEAVHRLLCDLRGNEDLFGGVPAILGGDFAQTLPIVAHGYRARTVAASLRRSFVWHGLEVMTLRQNMRLQGAGLNADFARWLANLSYNQQMMGPINLPTYIHRASTTAELCERVFPAAELANASQTPGFFAKRAILAIRNDQLPPFNASLMDQLPGEVHTYYAVDRAHTEDGDSADEVPREYLQTIQVSGLPPSILQLKVGSPVMLLRNLRPQDGLCNGTRLVVTHLGRYIIRARILTGDYEGDEHLIPRIELSTLDGELPWILSRRQFPIRPCFAITINKSQGQSLDVVGVDLQTSAFAHGQLYVALSRCTDVYRLTILLPEGIDTTLNVVWPEVLDGL